MDRLSSGTLPIIEYGGGQAIRLYAMWTLFQHAPAYASACQHFSTLQRTAVACQHFSMSACRLLVQVIGQRGLAVKIHGCWDVVFGAIAVWGPILRKEEQMVRDGKLEDLIGLLVREG